MYLSLFDYDKLKRYIRLIRNLRPDKVFCRVSTFICLILILSGCNAPGKPDYPEAMPTHAVTPTATIASTSAKLPESISTSIKIQLTETPVITFEPTLTPTAKPTQTPTVNPLPEVILIENIDRISTMFTFLPDELPQYIFWSGDSKMLVSLSASSIVLYQAPIFKQVQDLPTLGDNQWFGLDNNNEFILVGKQLGREFQLGLWDFRTGEASTTLKYRWYYIGRVALIPSGSEVFIAGREQFGQPSSVKRIDVRSGEMLQVYAPFPNDPCGVSISPDNELLAASVCGRDSESNQVSLWNIESGELLEILPGYYTNNVFTEFNHSGDYLAVYYDALRLWDLNHKEWYAEIEVQNLEDIEKITFSSDIRLVGYITDRGRLFLVNAPTNETVFNDLNVAWADFSPNGRYLAVLKTTGEINILGVHK